MSYFCFTFFCVWFTGFIVSETLYFYLLRPLRPDSVGYCSLIIFTVTIPASLCAAAIISLAINRMKPQVKNENTPLLDTQIYDI